MAGASGWWYLARDFGGTRDMVPMNERSLSHDSVLHELELPTRMRHRPTVRAVLGRGRPANGETPVPSLASALGKHSRRPGSAALSSRPAHHQRCRTAIPPSRRRIRPVPTSPSSLHTEEHRRFSRSTGRYCIQLIRESHCHLLYQRTAACPRVSAHARSRSTPAACQRTG